MEDDKIDENNFTGLCRDVSLTTIPITILMYIIFIIEQRKIKKGKLCGMGISKYYIIQYMKNP